MNKNNNSMKNLWDRLSHSHQELVTLQAKEYPVLAGATMKALKDNVLWSDLGISDISRLMTTLNIGLGDQTMYMVYYGDGIIREAK